MGGACAERRVIHATFDRVSPRVCWGFTEPWAETYRRSYLQLNVVCELPGTLGGRLWQWSCTSLIPLAVGSRGQPLLIVWTVCGTPPALWLSPGCNLSLCTHRWDSCTKPESNVPWQGDDTLHWTFEMTQHSRLNQALLSNIYQLSVRVLFSTSSTPRSCSSSLLQIKALVMQHSPFSSGCNWQQYNALLIQKARKGGLCIYICYPTA